ncbi:MAG: four-carbon acid sugar kinase family protein [bacterium]
MTFDFLGVVADDLTGAGDAGAALARHGWPALILVNGVRGVAGGWPAIAINTESRHLSPAAAARRTAAACRWLARAGATRIFKKIDSTLRGHPVRESLAGARAVKARRIPWVPAFPEAGRTTVGGVHRVDGRPVGETFESYLPAVIRRSAGRDAGRFEAPLNVRTTAELRRVARAFKGDRYAAGSAGFLDALLCVWFARSGPAGVWATGHAPLASGPVLLVNGSATPVARRQVAAYRRRFPRDSVVAAPVRRGNPAGVMRKVVRAAEKLAQRARPAGLILAGGETAWRVATRLGIRGLVVRSALGPGVAGCEAIMATNGWVGARVVLKPGGFGGDDVLIRARRWISG